MLESENVKIIVAGNYPESLQVPDNLILLGNISDQRELAKYYSMADVTVLTSKKETFSMVVAESLCCGTPVVGFKAGAPEQIALIEECNFVEWGNTANLKDAVSEILMNIGRRQCIADIAKQRYSKNTMVEKYRALYVEITA